MGNLTLENLGNIIQSGNADALLGGGAPVSETRVAAEMAKNGLEVPAGDAADASKTFSGMLRDSIDKVNTLQQQADTSVKELVAGRTKNIHETMLAIERADTSLKLMMQVRNKVLDAYREIMRMQV